MKIKVCGMREAANIVQIADLDPDYMGFIFYPDSARYVNELVPDVLREIPGNIKKTGVFVNSPLEDIIEMVKTYGLDAVQLHGNESVQLCLELAKGNVEVIKAFGVDKNTDFSAMEPYYEAVDYFMFDTKSSGYGGSGELFDWSLLEKYTHSKPYFLSGGLSPENISQVKDIKDERLYAIDLNSRFEIQPGIKDAGKISSAIDTIRSKKEIHELPRK